MNMKKIIGILLALCFLVSMTAGAASANGGKEKKDWGNDKNWGNDRDHKKCFEWKWIKTKGHMEKIVEKKVFYKHGEKVVVKTVKKVWVPGKWIKIKVPVPCKHHGHHGHNGYGDR